MYEKIVGMNPSPERTEIYNEMQDMLLHDCPYTGGMARTRHYVIHEHMKYFKPVEVFENWFKYVDIVHGDETSTTAAIEESNTEATVGISE